MRLFAIILMFFAVNVQAKSLSEIIGIPKLAEVNLMKAEIAKTADAIVKVQADMEVKVGRLEAQLNVKPQVSVPVGVANRTEQTNQENRAGRDVTTRVNNSTDLIKFIFDKIGYILAAMFTFLTGLFGGVWGILTVQAKGYTTALEAKDKQISFLINLFMKADTRSDDAKNRLIERLIMEDRGGEKV